MDEYTGPDHEDFELEPEETEDAWDAFESDFGDVAPDMELELPLIESLELADIKARTAVLSKNDMVALLCLKTADKGGAICRVDPRESNPAVQIYDDPDKAAEWFAKSLRTSRKNGWQIVYDGLPLEG